jgi:regulatory protein
VDDGPEDPAAQAPGPAEDDLGDPEQVARNICLRALTGAAKTRKQLADLLAKRGIPEEAADAVLDRFSEVGLIDDAAFARAWVSSRQSGRGLARRALSAELRAKGVDAEVASAALEELDPQDEWDAARRLVARRLPSLQRFDRVTAERRLLGMLARKGYGGGLAGHVVREALDARGDEGDGTDALARGEDADVSSGW